jgi:hypothetical protein
MSCARDGTLMFEVISEIVREIKGSSTEADADFFTNGLLFLKACTAEQIRHEPKKCQSQLTSIPL